MMFDVFAVVFVQVEVAGWGEVLLSLAMGR